MLNRRQWLRRLGAVSLAAPLARVGFAAAPTDARFVLVILRGAVDGLALAPPYGDGAYAGLREALALPPPGAEDGMRKLDGLFGLHPALANTHAMFLHNEALVVHAVASPYRQRSHFDAQDVLENGGVRAGDRRDGWLNRALQSAGTVLGPEPAIAMAQNVPLVLRGERSVASFAPSGLDGADDDTLARLADLYADDAFFHERLARALAAQELAVAMDGMDGKTRRRNSARAFIDALKSAARFLTAPNGPRIAVTELSGWDTHANQGTTGGTLARQFTTLDTGLGALRDELGPTWRKTVVAVVTEFGRTVRINGTRGTAHGAGPAAPLLGGALNGGRAVAPWPGLGASNLYQDRDLFPTTDVRRLFASVLAEHMQLGDRAVSNAFADAKALSPMDQLIRTT
ncbi:MAG: DUF1501 domain-containing protein [Gammaproteobacteria bacterium]